MNKKDIWEDFRDELAYRVVRAHNEVIDDMDEFIECAMKELVPLAIEAVTLLKAEEMYKTE